MRFGKGFLGKFGENFLPAGYLVFLRPCPAAGHVYSHSVCFTYAYDKENCQHYSVDPTDSHFLAETE